MSGRVEPGILLLTSSPEGMERQRAVLRLAEVLRTMRECLDEMGQSREISLAHTSLDSVSMWAAFHVLKVRELGTTPAQRAARHV